MQIQAPKKGATAKVPRQGLAPLPDRQRTEVRLGLSKVLTVAVQAKVRYPESIEQLIPQGSFRCILYDIHIIAVFSQYSTKQSSSLLAQLSVLQLQLHHQP